MGEVQKYDIDQTDGDFAYMAPCPDGEWVQVESYQALEAERDRLKEQAIEILEMFLKAGVGNSTDFALQIEARRKADAFLASLNKHE